MNKFVKFYKNCMNMKLHISIYSIALLIIICIARIFHGINSIDINLVFQVIIVSFVLGIIDINCFPPYKKIDKNQFIFNTIVWAGCANFLFIPSAIVFEWFTGVTIFGAILLLLILQIGLFAIWYGIYLDLNN